MKYVSETIEYVRRFPEGAVPLVAGIKKSARFSDILHSRGMRPRVFGLIHTTPSAHYTAHALASLITHTPLRNEDKVVVIENDESRIDPGPLGRSVQIIKNDNPRGFAENGNVLVRLALEHRSDLIFMNNDIVLTPGWSDPILRDADAILSPLSNREFQYVLGPLHTRVSMDLNDLVPHMSLLPQLVEMHRQRADGYLRVLVLPFFCVRIPLPVLEKVGCFDPAFGKGGAEDYDYCLRAVLSDIPIKYALGSYIIHFGGKSSWSGAETAQQQREREEKFHRAFREKWGEQLWHMALQSEDHDSLAGPVAAEIQEGRYRDLVIRTASSPIPPVKL